MSIFKYKIFFLISLGLMGGGLLPGSKVAQAEDISKEVVSKYLSTFKVPSAEDEAKCKGNEECAVVVSTVEKNNLQLKFLLNPLSESILQLLPADIAGGLKDNRAALRSFGDAASLGTSTDNQSFTIGENGQPNFGGSNPQEIVWGHILGQTQTEVDPGSGGGLSNSKVPNSHVFSDGEEAGQSTAVSPSDNSAPSNPQTPSNPETPSNPQRSSDSEARAAEARILYSLDVQLINEEFEEYRSQIERQNQAADLNKNEKPSALGDFLRLYNPLNYLKDEDANASNNSPVLTPPIAIDLHSLSPTKSFNLIHPGLSDPADTNYQASQSPDQGKARAPTTAEREKAQVLVGAGGYTQTQKSQWYGSGNRPFDVQEISSANCPQGADGSPTCRTPGSVH